jgi:phosphatidylserine/phosphatidylglycerophosphate/cardiolipin synthase-like enzyme
VDGAQMETGSFNYSENATENNGENQLYLNDAEVIQRYEQNFTTMYNNGLAN